MDAHILSLLRNTTGADRESLLALVKGYDMKRKIQVTTRVPVRTSTGDRLMIPEFLVLTSRVLETQDVVEDCEDLRKVLALTEDIIPSYSVHTYALYDLLGCDFEPSVPLFKHLPRWVVSSDGHRIPLPRIIDYSSSVLNDDELLKITEMPVPFTKGEINNAIRLVLNMSHFRVADLAFIDFLGCDAILDKCRVQLSYDEWLDVLQMHASLAQKLSGWKLDKNKLTSSKGTITLENDKYVLESKTGIEGSSLIHALHNTGLKLVKKIDWRSIDVCAVRPDDIYDFKRPIFRITGTVVDGHVHVAIDFSLPLLSMMGVGRDGRETDGPCIVTIDVDGYKFERTSLKTSILELRPTTKWSGEGDVDITMISAKLSKDDVKTGRVFSAKVNM